MEPSSRKNLPWKLPATSMQPFLNFHWSKQMYSHKRWFDFPPWKFCQAPICPASMGYSTNAWQPPPTWYLKPAVVPSLLAPCSHLMGQKYNQPAAGLIEAPPTTLIPGTPPVVHSYCVDGSFHGSMWLLPMDRSKQTSMQEVSCTFFVDVKHLLHGSKFLFTSMNGCKPTPMEEIAYSLHIYFRHGSNDMSMETYETGESIKSRRTVTCGSWRQFRKLVE